MMKKITIVVFCTVFSVFAKAQSFNCIQLINTTMNAGVEVNSSTQVCFSSTSGMFVAALPPFVPPIDTAYITQQDSLGNAYFATDSCIVFEAFGATGTATVKYTIQTTNGCTKSGTLNITITCPAATANDDSYSVFSNGEGQLLMIGENDAPIAGPATYTIIKNPTKGTLSFSNDSVWFVGNGALGMDTFTYVLQNACGETGTASVFLNIVELVANDDAVTATQETEIEIAVIANDVSADNPSVQVCNNPTNGTVAVSETAIKYTGNANFPSAITDADTTAGLDSFCYVMCASLNGNQRCDTAMVYVTVVPKTKFFIPQGFSPNGDGVNDALEIAYKDKYPNSYLIIYNRYGMEVWRSGQKYDNNFVGRAPNGQELPDGTYYYIYKFNDGVTKDMQGYFVLNR